MCTCKIITTRITTYSIYPSFDIFSVKIIRTIRISSCITSNFRLETRQSFNFAYFECSSSSASATSVITSAIPIYTFYGISNHTRDTYILRSSFLYKVIESISSSVYTCFSSCNARIITAFMLYNKVTSHTSSCGEDGS